MKLNRNESKGRNEIGMRRINLKEWNKLGINGMNINRKIVNHIEMEIIIKIMNQILTYEIL